MGPPVTRASRHRILDADTVKARGVIVSYKIAVMEPLTIDEAMRFMFEALAANDKRTFQLGIVGYFIEIVVRSSFAFDSR
jgi:hypothetical protein